MPLLVEPALPAGALRTLPQPVLRVGPGLTLRPWQPSDAPVVRAAFDQPDIQRWHVRRLDNEAEVQAWIAGWADRWAAESSASWAITDQDDQAVGQLGLRTVNLAEGEAQLSYWVLPPSRGTGAAARSVRTLTAWTFEELGLHRLFLMHSTANVPSCRVAGRAGYPLEGTLRGALRHPDGWHDAHIHGRLRTDAA